LAGQPLDWANVTLTLVDERWVPPGDTRSNESFVRANLLQGAAATARFVPLYQAGAATPEAGVPTIAASIAMLDLPFDALILGMGEDGHTASFFPDADHLAEATDPKTDAIVLPINARSAGEPRITLTLPTILASRTIYLHIEGERKREVLETARYVAPTNHAYPIAAVLRNAHAPLKVYWCA